MTGVEHATPGRVLAIYAHPDDPHVAAGGAIARWAADGALVHLVMAARGEKGSMSEASDPDELAVERAAELDRAAAAAGISSWESLGLPDGEVENTVELRGRLVAAIRTFRPEVVLTHDPTAVFFGDAYLNHHDHRTLGWAVLDACAPAAASPLYFPDAGEPHQIAALYLSGTLQPDAFVDIGGVIDKKVDALCHHRSQVGDDATLVRDVVVSRAREAGRAAGIEHAEGFRRLVFR